MGHTEASRDNHIGDDLLDTIIDLYLKTSGQVHSIRTDLLKEDVEQIKHNLAISHGVGECLKHILKHTDTERIHGRCTRELAWNQIIGTLSRGDRGQGETRITTEAGLSNKKSGDSFISSRNK